MTTFKQALDELEDNGVAVYHHGTPTRGAYIVIAGTYYTYNKFESMSVELRKAVKESYNKLKQNNTNNNVGSKTTNPTGEEILQYLLSAGEASQAKVQWGKSYRNVVIIQGKNTNIRGLVRLMKNYLKVFYRYI